MKKLTKMGRAREALNDPEVLAYMRKDPELAQYFDASGKLNVDLTKPGVVGQIVDAIMFRRERRRL